MQRKIRTRSTPSLEPLLLDPEVEKTARRNNSQRRRENRTSRNISPAPVISEQPNSSTAHQEMGDMSDDMNGNGDRQARRTLEDYSTFAGPLHFNSIARPRVNAVNMEMKPALIHLVQSNQFNGLSHENPYNHLATFLEICNTVKIHQVPDEAIRLSLFPFSLGGNAKMWLNSFPENSFTTWEDVVAKFLNKFFPQSKVNKGKQEISSFQQDVNETLSQAWDRFKGLLRKTPTHGFDEPTVLNMFLGGLRSQTKLMLDASAGGNIRWKTPEEAHELIENMAANDSELQNERAQQKGVFQLQSQDALLAQNKIMTQQLEALMNKLSQLPKELQNVSQAQHQGCELCDGEHANGHCAMQVNTQEDVNYMEALQQMPAYAKFMKELLTKKRKYIEEETIEVQGNCSAIIQKLLPPKFKDPGSFTIPCTIGKLAIGKALIDLGASINLMPFSLFEKIGVLELKPTRMSLQLADRSIKYPLGVVEDVLVRVDKFVFPVDFVIMEMEADVEVPLILGRPFMKTTRVLIDVDDGKLKVRVEDEEVNFNVFEAMSHPSDEGACFQVDVLDEACVTVEREIHVSSPLIKTLIDARESLNEEEEKMIEERLTDLDVLKEIPSNEMRVTTSL
ncbi:uncharacterized protein LOC128193955 [Vigna angularis]|uniref:uncharacterized protein LOC128193955 n=1 Tax=Phaseolus angularis TaxID=3914 RepID=UPI0022B40498|nr:uncharacterized protein LOC128193955 [Vigna angularis]